MKDYILGTMRQVEKDFDVKVLFASEAGSRAYGLSSNDSDYDVRFIYINRMDWYLSIDQNRDVIEIAEGTPLSVSGKEGLDVRGWEMRKTLRLLRKSNPSLMEWLYSGIVYFETLSVAEDLRLIAKDVFSGKVCMYHYLNMARQNARKYLQEADIPAKKHLAVIRPVLAARWLEQFNSFPPMEFDILLEGTVTDENLKHTIQKIKNNKKGGERFSDKCAWQKLNLFIHEETERLGAAASGMKQVPDASSRKLDRFFRRILEKAWSLEIREKDQGLY